MKTRQAKNTYMIYPLARHSRWAHNYKNQNPIFALLRKHTEYEKACWCFSTCYDEHV